MFLHLVEHRIQEKHLELNDHLKNLILKLLKVVKYFNINKRSIKG